MTCLDKQLSIILLPLPLDVIYIINDYVFANFFEKQKEKKTALLNQLINQSYTDYEELSSTDSSLRSNKKVMFFYNKSIPKSFYGMHRVWVDTRIKTEVCLKCRDFINPGTRFENLKHYNVANWERLFKHRRFNGNFSKKVTCQCG